ncbi:MAG: benzoyl-CoA-dihydrodiol lyase [Deltaproteobacteria bacterium]|nr:MAG: benzoyl-CoA-dihydrodiol lyase [Deltaproteobacteria bacterium]
MRVRPVRRFIRSPRRQRVARPVASGPQLPTDRRLVSGDGIRYGPRVPRIAFETDPSHYRHWKLELRDGIAVLGLAVDEDAGLAPGYALKLNSYDLGVDIELADAIQRLRFSHPEVHALVVTSLRERLFSAGANIYMLASSSHPSKVNFCKFTNETRLHLEEMSAESGIRTLAALNGTASGGGYELALACDEILLIDDGSAAVSFPEVPLLGVLPGTGGLTRLVDKRKVRRDRADFVATTAEGVKGKRAAEWRLVDEVVPRSEFEARVRERAAALATTSDRPAAGPGVELESLSPRLTPTGVDYRWVRLAIDREKRVASLTVRAPDHGEPETPAAFLEAGSRAWAIAAWRELDDALLHLRFNELEIGVVLLRTAGDSAAVLAVDRAIDRHHGHWLVREIALLQKRVLKRLDLTARSIFALVEPGSAFAGSLLELALAADRSYMLAGGDPPATIALSPLNHGALPTSSGLSRLEARFLGDPTRLRQVLTHPGPFDVETALELGLVTFAPDDIDWEDEVRLAIEERAAMNPDALTGMEANLRFPGPETLETKIFGRLSAWQNWIFTRPNTTGEKGALTLYGNAGQRPEFDRRRT